MSVFLEKLAALAPDPSEAEGRHWIFVPYDQLTDAVGPLARRAPEASGIVLVETLWKPRQRPYHKQKLALVIASQRHFALEQAVSGCLIGGRDARRADDQQAQQVSARVAHVSSGC